MKLNPDKECPFAPTKQYTESWERACPDFPGKASTAVRDLGIDHHSYHGGLPTLHARLDKLDIIAQHIGRLPLDQRHRANMARAVILGRGLHGTELTGAPQRHLNTLEKHMGTSIFSDLKVTNRTAAMLLYKRG